MIKIYDTFPYNGDEILAFRLDYLYNVVDKFYIIEALETFSGAKKDRFYIDDVLPSLWKYKDKIHVVKIEDLPKRPESWTFSSNNNPDDWWRERIQREMCKPLLQQHPSPYIIFSGDVDEIPNRSIFNNLQWLYEKTYSPLYLIMDFYYYNFKWKKKQKWDQAFLLNDKNLYNEFLSQHKVFGNRANHINCGWHFSYFMSRANIRRKIASIGHTEYNINLFKQDEHIDACLKTGVDLFCRGQHEDCLPSNDCAMLDVPDTWKKFQLLLDDIQR